MLIMLKENILGMIFYNGCSQMENGQETSNNLFVLTIIYHLSLGASILCSSAISRPGPGGGGRGERGGRAGPLIPRDPT
jgi:hypothetical protein